MNQMSGPKKIGPELIVSILKEAKRPLTTMELQLETQRLVPNCVSSNVVILNFMRVSGIIKGKSSDDRIWIWWVEDKEESK
jgi:hypothetical protein